MTRRNGTFATDIRSISAPGMMSVASAFPAD
jgi:hypothetical protein